jgi:limonene-1,2-epoxide hydrolase
MDGGGAIVPGRGAGLFVVRDGLIARWVDYWDLATIQPLLATL